VAHYEKLLVSYYKTLSTKLETLALNSGELPLQLDLLTVDDLTNLASRHHILICRTFHRYTFAFNQYKIVDDNIKLSRVSVKEKPYESLTRQLFFALSAPTQNMCKRFLLFTRFLFHTLLMLLPALFKLVTLTYKPGTSISMGTGSRLLATKEKNIFYS